MRLEKKSPCKVNLILNILGKRADGFHELETVMQPVNLCDEMTFERAGASLQLTCSHPELPCDSKNLVHRAATSFLAAAKISDGVKIHLQKNLPLAGGIGGGSANAAVTFAALNELFSAPLPSEKLHALAAALGSDIPFFLYDRPALTTGRGEKVELLEKFSIAARQGVFPRPSRLRHFHAVVVSKPRAFSKGVERQTRSRGKIDFTFTNRLFENGGGGNLQFTRSTRV
jgi:4-diphosphocytidyl-2C-methyl-D-erythritol kinase